jgi:DnaJ-class molecular chaperone with C-terminal Zn finger domain
LLCVKELDFWQLILGTTVIVKSITGKELKLKIPARTKPGSLLRLKQQGIVRKGHNTGDVLVKIVAVMPDNIPGELVHSIAKHVENK